MPCLRVSFGPGRHFVNKGILSHVIGGWDISGLWTLYTGMHYNPVDAVANISGSQYPGLFTVDFGLHPNFAIKEKVRFAGSLVSISERLHRARRMLLRVAPVRACSSARSHNG